MVLFSRETGTTGSCRNQRRHSSPDCACWRSPFELCRTIYPTDTRFFVIFYFSMHHTFFPLFARSTFSLAPNGSKKLIIMATIPLHHPLSLSLMVQVGLKLWLPTHNTNSYKLLVYINLNSIPSILSPYHDNVYPITNNTGKDVWQSILRSTNSDSSSSKTLI